MQPGDIVRIIPKGDFERFRCGSLGDGRYVSLHSGITGRVREIRLSMADDDDDTILFVPSGFPENEFTRGFFMGRSFFEPWDGEEVPCEVFYQVSGQRVPAPFIPVPQ